jgi:segregation and condensation protein B
MLHGASGTLQPAEQVDPLARLREFSQLLDSNVLDSNALDSNALDSNAASPKMNESEPNQAMNNNEHQLTEPDREQGPNLTTPPLFPDEAEPAPLPTTSSDGELFLGGLVESLLFVADEPVEPAKLAEALQCSVEEIETELETLQSLYVQTKRGLRIQRRNGKVQMVTAPAAAQAIENFLNLDLSTRLSGPALETLAIVAYRQPVTRAQIEAVRGVDCSGVLRKLLQLGLLEEVGRLETPGRPILYGITDQFLQHFGLTSVDELPPLPEEDADTLRSAVELALEEAEP